MQNDPLVIAAIFTFLGTLVTGVLGTIVALYTNRTEKRKTAEVTVENVLEKHLDFKDDVIEFKDQRIRELEDRLAACELVIRELREQLQPEKRESHDG